MAEGGWGAELTKRRERGDRPPLRARRNICVCKGFDSPDIVWHFWRSLARSILFWLNRGAGTVSRRHAACLTRFYHASQPHSGGRREEGRGPSVTLASFLVQRRRSQAAASDSRNASKKSRSIASSFLDRPTRNRFGRRPKIPRRISAPGGSKECRPKAVGKNESRSVE